MTAYDAYWSVRQGAVLERLRRRSLQRARIALDMLAVRAGTLLDVGCGPGFAAELLATHGFTVTGFEAAPSAAAAARTRGIAVLEGDLSSGPLPGAPYDVVVAFEVLEHLPDPLQGLEALRAACRPGGDIIVSLPNEWHVLRRLAILFGAELFGGADDPHVRHFGLASARRFLTGCGLEVRGMRAASVIPPGIRVGDALGGLLARVAPRLFGLSFVFHLRDGAAERGRSTGEGTCTR